MLTGDLRGQIDQIWNSFWMGGISNPLEVIEQITYLLFIRRLDELHTLEERKSARINRPIARRIFPEGTDPRGRPFEDLRWSRFKNFAPAEMFIVLGEHVFPFLRTLGGDGSTYSHHMKDARFTIPTAALPSRVVDMLDAVPMAEHACNNLPDFLARWQKRDGAEAARPRTSQSFCVPKAEIAAAGFDLSLNRYREAVREEVAHRTPKKTLTELRRLEAEAAGCRTRAQRLASGPAAVR